MFLHLVAPLEGVEAISLPVESLQQSGKMIITLDETPSDIDYVIEVLF